MKKAHVTKIIPFLLSAALALPIMAQEAAVSPAVFAGAQEGAEKTSLAFPTVTDTVCEWDSVGNLLSETAQDLSGAPALNARGFYKAVYTYDEHSNLLSEAYTGLNGEPVNTIDGYASASYTWRTDAASQSYILTEDRYDASGARAAIPGSYSYRRDTYDGDQLLSTEYFDETGAPVRPTGGYAKIINEVKAVDDTTVITTRYLDADGSPLTGNEGGAVVVSTYAAGANFSGNTDRAENPENAAEAQRVFATINVEKTGVSTKPLLLFREIYGADGQRVLGANRYHRQVNTYNAAGSVIRTDYFGIDDEPVISDAGYASVTHERDSLDRVIKTDYYGTDGRLRKLVNGAASITYEYYGDTTTVHYTRYFGADGERTMLSTGYSMTEEEYNGENYDYRITYYDILDDITMADSGRARDEILYAHAPGGDREANEQWRMSLDQVKEWRFYGPDLKLIELKAGYAGYVNERNDYGQVIRTTYMDDHWEPTRTEERQLASITYEYEGTSPDEPPSARPTLTSWASPPRSGRATTPAPWSTAAPTRTSSSPRSTLTLPASRIRPSTAQPTAWTLPTTATSSRRASATPT